MTTSVNLDSTAHANDRQKLIRKPYRKVERETDRHKMHRDAGPPNRKFICINFQCECPAPRCIYLRPKRLTDDHTERQKITKGPRTTGWTDGHIILSLKGFEPVACGIMRCKQIRAGPMRFYCQFKAVKKIRYNLCIYI